MFPPGRREWATSLVFPVTGLMSALMGSPQTAELVILSKSFHDSHFTDEETKTKEVLAGVHPANE